MNRTTIIVIILGVLVLVSAAQAVQLNGLKEKISEGDVNVGSKKTTSSSSSSGSDSGVDRQIKAPPSIQNLPQMVGGC